MRAVAVAELKAPPQLIDAPRPAPGHNEVLVKVEAAGLNPLDWRIADGMLDGTVPHEFPLIMGVDFAGRVEEAGPGVTRFAVEDAVYGQRLSSPVGSGTYAEYVVVPQDAPIAKAPDSVPLTTAAGAPTAGMTALEIIDAAGLREYESLLVVGAAGGVGTFLTQLAAAHDLRVVAATRGHDQRRMGTYGAALAIDVQEHSLAERVRDEYPDGVDALVDLASGPEEFGSNAELVRNGGVALSTLRAADKDAVYARTVEAINFAHTSTPEVLEKLAAEIDSGRVIVPITTEVPLDQAPDAVARSKAGGTRGKTVILA
ncbi:NADP-dependent oxidoreductase [Streptomyces sulphureus]|uniref:NADP-dependent oxidoreductase n=1 Tax=Streptomyces sulphureus TaxID=47758 RepID=UPI0003A16233|nr:NADP-dependent oxidoreductase [Streptomyces sulphureus]